MTSPNDAMTKLYDGYHGRDLNPQSVPDNKTQYMQGRADQKRVDRIVAVACLAALVAYIVWGH